MDRIDIIATLFLLIDHRKHDTSTVVMLLLIVCYAGVCVGRRAAGRAYCRPVSFSRCYFNGHYAAADFPVKSILLPLEVT